ncbi:uncharacterized protein LOC143453096 [Clavelina lepadiformis]|uniref:uncharacterized protein LOC143453096 n=1 Tax=Clavelina lepadiformis TaxID=159417 RepID=UPI0040431618
MPSNSFCADLLKNGGLLAEYAYMGTREKKWAENWSHGMFPGLNVYDVLAITSSGNRNFFLHGQEYKFVENKGSIHIFASTEKSLAYGWCLRYILVVVGHVDAHDHCERAVDYGLSYIKCLED